MPPEPTDNSVTAAWWCENRRKNPPELGWLIGRKVKSVEKADYTWFFVFDDDSSIATEDTWRLINAGQVVVTSEDHGHRFGLPSPIDAAHKAMLEVSEDAIQQFEVDVRTGDLSLYIRKEKILQFLQLSCGYESWHAASVTHEVICTGGGSLFILDGGEK
jgi:hypothetical protein